MILFFDTETTGFASKSKEASDPKQAHLVQLAAQLVTPNDRTVMEFSVIVKPVVPIPQAASDIHGITDEIAAKYGVTESTAVDFFLHLRSFSSKDVAHQVAFDQRIMELAMIRRGIIDRNPMIEGGKYCTMQAVKRLNLGKSNLTFCMNHFFGEDHTKAHDAMADTKACRRVYFQLNKAA